MDASLQRVFRWISDARQRAAQNEPLREEIRRALSEVSSALRERPVLPGSPPLLGARQVSWADEVFSIGLRPLGKQECCLALNPLLHLQLRIGYRALHALLDNGASDNFIDSTLARDLGLEL